jgi:site-specific DNA-cytosine methylase
MILHENSGRFLDWIFPQWLPDYDWTNVLHPEKATTLLLSPHQFGWPGSRPRLYTLGIRRKRIQLKGRRSCNCKITGHRPTDAQLVVSC